MSSINERLHISPIAMSTAAQLTGAISNEVKRELRARQVGQQAGGGAGSRGKTSE